MTIGLVAGGATAKACIAALKLADRLGPVAAPTLRLASRIANSLKAGYAVAEYGELRDVQQILICVPQASLDSTVTDLSASALEWQGRTVLYSGGRRGSDGLAPLHSAGASTGSLHEVDGAPGYFVIEGDPEAVRQARRLVNRAGGKPIQVASGTLPLFFAGLAFASSLFTPVIEGSIECLRGAGATPQAASHITHAVLARSLRGHKNGGRKSWSGALASGDEKAVLEEWHALEKHAPLLALYYAQSVAFALQSFRRHADLLATIRAVT